MQPLPLIIDCDPGVDDGVALLWAWSAAELDVRAITTVAGNVDGEKTARNGRMLRQIAGADTPVYRGALTPLRHSQGMADEFHGASGLGGLELFEPEQPLAPGDAAAAIIDLVMAAPVQSISLAVLGPMTNVALAMRAEPRLAEHLKQIVCMGGAAKGGNITNYAEFNIWADPEAAAEVFASEARVVVFGLDATHQVRTPPDRIEQVAAIGGGQAETAAALLEFAMRTADRNRPGELAPLHDPCVIAWLLQPDLFEIAPCQVDVETEDGDRRGQTRVDFSADPARARHHWAVKVDGAGVHDLLLGYLATASARATERGAT